MADPKINTGPDKNRVTEVIVTRDDAGQRIDNFLLRILKGVPKSHIYRLLRKGEVRVNKGRKKADYRLQADDVVRIPPIRTTNRDGSPPKIRMDWLDAAVLYQDDDILVLNKPSGLAVHGGSGIKTGLIEGLKGLGGEYDRVELVHRLDRETSGCLLLAKQRTHLRQLQDQMRANDISKCYQLLVKGQWQYDDRRVDKPLLKFTLQGGERMVRVDPTGKTAITEFSLIEQFADTAALLEARLLTGRTHQIRVHAASIDHPIAGDARYGDKAFNQVMKQEFGLKRLFLHASSLEFRHPDSGRMLRIDCPLPDELQALTSRLAQEK